MVCSKPLEAISASHWTGDDVLSVHLLSSAGKHTFGTAFRDFATFAHWCFSFCGKPSDLEVSSDPVTFAISYQVNEMGRAQARARDTGTPSRSQEIPPSAGSAGGDESVSSSEGIGSSVPDFSMLPGVRGSVSCIKPSSAN